MGRSESLQRCLRRRTRRAFRPDKAGLSRTLEIVLSLKFVSDDAGWLVGGKSSPVGDDGQLILLPGELASLRAVDLQRALAESAEEYGGVALIAQDDDPDEYGPFEPVSFSWTPDGLRLELVHSMPWPADGRDETAAAELRALLQPLLAARGAEAVVDHDGWNTTRLHVGLNVSIKMPLRGRTVADLVRLGKEVVILGEALADGTPTRQTVANLIRGGGSRVLVGQPESSWLDVKSQEYNLAVDHGQISLAEAVTRFCNGDEGGIVLVGAEAKKVPGGEVIKKVGGVQAAPGAVARYRRAIDRHVYPPPYGLRVDVIPLEGDRSLVLVDIPDQPEELKPFLVHGAVRPDGRVEGSYISILRRRGDESIAITAPMIHAQLAAGRALLRGRQR